VIEVLYFADKQVKAKLFARVAQGKKLLMVTTVPPHRAKAAAAKKEPFGSLERNFGDAFDQVLVIDEGSTEGMWRDPVTDLADALYAADSRSAYDAASGYFFVEGGVAKAVVKRFGTPEEDAWLIQEALARLTRGVSPPDPAKRPGRGKKAAAARAAAAAAAGESSKAPRPLGKDPYAVLGLLPEATLAEAKRAWRALIIQYHPDKVAHLAPEFRALAETRTRELMEAWEQLQEQLG
jgi:hypothetical protein